MYTSSLRSVDHHEGMCYTHLFDELCDPVSQQYQERGAQSSSLLPEHKFSCNQHPQPDHGLRQLNTPYIVR